MRRPKARGGLAEREFLCAQKLVALSKKFVLWRPQIPRGYHVNQITSSRTAPTNSHSRSSTQGRRQPVHLVRRRGFEGEGRRCGTGRRKEPRLTARRRAIDVEFARSVKIGATTRPANATAEYSLRRGIIRTPNLLNVLAFARRRLQLRPIPVDGGAAS